MENNYLVSPFSDAHLKQLKLMQASFINSPALKEAIEYGKKIMSLYSKSIPKPMFNQVHLPLSSKNMLGIDDKIFNKYSNDILSHYSKVLEDQVKSGFGIYNIEISNIINRRMRNFPINIHLMNYQNDNFKNMISQLLDVANSQSFIEKYTIYSNQKVKKGNSPVETKSEVDITTEAEKIEVLRKSLFYLGYNVEKFKEVIHSSYSYVSERKIAVFGLSNSIIYAFTMAAQIHPLLPFVLFNALSVLGLFTPKDD